MKDYSLNFEESKNFIKSYNVSDNQIIAVLVSGEIYIIAYNEENEKIILERMENQARDTYDIECKLNKSFNKDIKWCIFQTILCAANAFVLFGGIYAGGWLTPSTFVLTGLATVINGLSGINTKLKLHDIKKNKFFLNNKNKLNDNVKRNENILSGISKKTTKQIEQTPINKPVFDINIIDNISLRDLKTLKENIERDLAFGFNQETQNPKVKIKYFFYRIKPVN